MLVILALVALVAAAGMLVVLFVLAGLAGLFGIFLLIVFVPILLGLAGLLWYWYSHYYRYWERKGVPGPRGWPLLGSSRPWRLPPSRLYSELYERYRNKPFVGFYEILKRRLLVLDPDLIHGVLVTDFASFSDRAVFPADESNPLDMSLFTLNNPLWRAVRNKISPAFTTGKLKAMFDQLAECTDHLVDYIKQKSSADVSTREAMFVFTIDVIASTAFGIEVNTMSEADSKFRMMSAEAFKMSPLRILKLMAVSNFPVLGKLFGAAFVPRNISEYFTKIIKDTIEERERSGRERKDFIQLLVQLKEKGSIEPSAFQPDDAYLEQQGTDSMATPPIHLTVDMLVAQAFTFLTAGSEPACNTLTFALLELARHPEIQDKAREEVRVVHGKYEAFTYDAVKEMTYLENCILETMRMYPVGKQLLRMCTKSTVLGGTRIEAGTNLVIPVRALHFDPEHFDEPHTFDPTRFEHPLRRGTFLPFGEGPRMCIGMRFAMVEMKLTLAKLLNEFRVRPSPKTKEVILNEWSFFSVPKEAVFLNFSPAY